MTSENIIVKATDLEKLYPVQKGFMKSLFSTEEEFVHAVDGVNINIKEGTKLGLVGESGCGKTTVGYLLVNLLAKTGGKVIIEGHDINEISGKDLRELRKKMQIIFQNPYESLSPRFSVLDIIAEPLRLLNITYDEKEIKQRVIDILEDVGLVPAIDYLDRYPHELSGGQRQRVGVARAFVLDPIFVVADEPVSMLDVSMRVGVLKIMNKLAEDKGTAFLFITHDLALARTMCDEIAVMYLGRIIEQGATDKILKNPLHPYTKALISAVPKPDPRVNRSEDLPIIGEIPSGINIPSGCRFRPRCIYSEEKCSKIDPKLERSAGDHFVACIRYEEINALQDASKEE